MDDTLYIVYNTRSKSFDRYMTVKMKNVYVCASVNNSHLRKQVNNIYTVYGTAVVSCYNQWWKQKRRESNEKVIFGRRGNTISTAPRQRDVFDNFNYNPLGIAVIQVR